jgi:hypothetical protein
VSTIGVGSTIPNTSITLLYQASFTTFFSLEILLVISSNCLSVKIIDGIWFLFINTC